MADIEVYKIKKTVDPAVREYGMFEFFGTTEGPMPENYVREWSGTLDNGNLDMLCGRFFLNPPKDYHGGPLEKSDIVVVDGEPCFLDRDSGYKFVEVDFDTSGIKDAIHVEYGRYVSIDEAVQIPRTFAIVCESLDIPIGYLGEPGYHGSSKGISDFDPLPHNEYSPCYLHPQFMKGEEAREFVSLLKELSETDRWGQIAGYLRENYPVTMRDLETAREAFAPELLLPAELRPFSKVIPVGSDAEELALLDVEVNNLYGADADTFNAVIEAGWNCGSVAELIDTVKNINRYELQPAFSAEQYGDFLIQCGKDDTADIFNRLEQSSDPEERAFARYVLRLEAAVDEAAYGRAAAEEENGVFTQYGYLTGKDQCGEINRGALDAPGERRESEALSAQEKADGGERLSLPGIHGDETLGRFLYDNKLLSAQELQAANARLSFTAYPEDCYRNIGRRRRETENGSFAPDGYVEKGRQIEKPSILDQIIAARTERAAAPEPSGKDKPKSRDPEL